MSSPLLQLAPWGCMSQLSLVCQQLITHVLMVIFAMTVTL